MAGKLSFLENNSMLPPSQFVERWGLGTCNSLLTGSRCQMVALDRSMEEGFFSRTSQLHLIGLVTAVCCIS